MIRNKYIIIISTIVLVGFVATLGYFYLSSQDNKSHFTLIQDDGKVEYKLPNTDSFKKAADKQTFLPSGTSINTNDDSNVQILLPDNSLITPDKNAQFVIAFESKKIDITQSVGSLWYRIRKLAGDEQFNTHTPNALTTVRGTKYFVSSYDNYSEVGVVEGKVGTWPQKVKTDENEVLVEKDQLLPITASSVVATKQEDKIGTIQIPDVIKDTDWYKRNKILDDIFDQKPVLNVDTIKETTNKDNFKELLPESPSNSNSKQNDTKPAENRSTPLPDSTKSFIANFSYSKLGISICGAQSDLVSAALGQTHDSRVSDLVNIYKDEVVNSCADGVLTLEEQSKISNISRILSQIPNEDITLYYY